MRRTTRITLAAVCSLVLVSGAAACSSSGGTSTGRPAGGGSTASTTGAGTNAADTKHVNLIFNGIFGNDYVGQTWAGVQAYAKDHNVTVTKQDSTADPTTQFNQIKTIAASGQYDALVLIPLDGAGIVPAIQDALKAGIKVVNTDFSLGTDTSIVDPKITLPGISGSVWDTYVWRGQQMAKAWIAACQGIDPCNGAFINGITALPWETTVRKTLEAEIKSHPNIHMVSDDQQAGGYVVDGAIPPAKAILTAHPDLTVLAAVSDPIAHGEELAAQSMGRAGKVKIIGIGGTTYAVQAINAGRWFASIVASPYTEGYLGTQMAVEAVRGQGGAPQAVSGTLQRCQKNGWPTLLMKGNIPADYKPEWNA